MKLRRYIIILMPFAFLLFSSSHCVKEDFLAAYDKAIADALNKDIADRDCIEDTWYKYPKISGSGYDYAVKLYFGPDGNGSERRVMPCADKWGLSKISFKWKVELGILYFSDFSDMTTTCDDTVISGPSDWSCAYECTGDELRLDDGNSIVWEN